ncbi:hypothetical protein, partial [Salmonella enterica]|uniref:hypothetical protein n=1 Tax=Salmonella enterica TaxID=28901 RepID=UPI001F24F9B6
MLDSCLELGGGANKKTRVLLGFWVAGGWVAGWRVGWRSATLSAVGRGGQAPLRPALARGRG